jgi:hypothetical protein
MIIQCEYCGKDIEKTTGHVNRAKKLGMGLFCNKSCWGLSRRDNKTEQQKKEEKAKYDRLYRIKNNEKIKNRNKKYNSSPAGRAMQKRNREKFKEYHLEYCRKPEYKKYKKKYDQLYRAKKYYGEYYEAAITLIKLKELIPMRETKQELNLINKSQKRKRNYEKLKCEKFKGNTLGNIE